MGEYRLYGKPGSSTLWTRKSPGRGMVVMREAKPSGDYVVAENGTWTPRILTIREKIKIEESRILRALAIQSLKDKGELPQDFGEDK